MADALRAMRVVPEFLTALDEVVMVEASPALQAIQKRALADAPAAVSWSDRFEPSDEGGALFLLANEFFDALPIRQFVRTERGWCERMVTADAAGAAVLRAVAGAAPMRWCPQTGVRRRWAASMKPRRRRRRWSKRSRASIARHGGARADRRLWL